ncbi:MAG: selenium cofactor biosynthesis protein YqeC, partial [Clostridia bacterium]|nr:selenium cofactor biosynthesis protein YqeC [Clostridia bacterium]
EPVIPACAALVVAVAGLDGLGLPILEAAHRPALFAEALGLTESHIAGPAELARILVSPAGQRRGVPPGARFCIALNKADTPARLEAARQVAALIDPALAERILITFHPQEGLTC